MAKTILSVKNLTVSLKTNKAKILENISFDINEGDVIAIDGKNGCGKSTLIRVLFGYTSDYLVDGEVIFNNYSNKNIFNMTDKELLDLRKHIGYVAQKDNYEGLNNLTIRDLIIDASNAIDSNPSNYFNLFEDLFTKRLKMNISLNSKPCKLSGGEQRLVSIFIGALCKKDAMFYIIDEPLNNLDLQNVMVISDLLNEIRLSNPNSAMLMVTHCKIITCVNRQRKLIDGILEKQDSKYECHHCMGEPDCNLFYLKR